MQFVDLKANLGVLLNMTNINNNLFAVKILQQSVRCHLLLKENKTAKAILLMSQDALKELSCGDTHNSIWSDHYLCNLEYCLETLDKGSETSLKALTAAAEENY
jgi:hypothetical protein